MHRTEVRVVWYQWHPWYGCEVHAHLRKQRDHAAGIYHCWLENESVGVLVPAWMLDEKFCSRIAIVSAARVSIEALRELRALVDVVGDSNVGGSVDTQQHGDKTATRQATCPTSSSRPASGTANNVGRDRGNSSEGGEGTCDSDDVSASALSLGGGKR